MIGILICFFLTLLLQIFMPFWWWILVVPFLYSVFRARSAAEALRIGAVSMGLLWLVVSLYLFFTSSGIIAGRVADMFRLGAGWLMIVLTAGLAAIAAGVAGMAGYWLKTGFVKE